MNRILTSVALCIAIAAAQQTDNATDTSAAVSAMASSTPLSSDAATVSNSASGPVVMVPVSASSEASLDAPTSTAATGTAEPASTQVLQQSVASSAPTSDEPSSTESPSYTFAPTTTAEAAASSSVDYTYAPTTTPAPSPVTASSEDSLSTPAADSTDSASLAVAQTETPASQLDTPTASPSDTPAATTSAEYTFSPSTTAGEAASSTPEYSFAPSSAAASQEYTYAPSSSETAPTIVPVLVPSGSSASFAIGSETIGMGQTATINSQPVIIQTNSMGNTEVKFGATGTPSMIAYHSSDIEIPASATEHAANYGASTLPTMDTASPSTETMPAATEQPSTFETQIATLNGHSIAIESPAFTAHTEDSTLTLNGHIVTATGQPALPSNVHVLNGHTFTESPKPTLASNEMVLNGKTLTVSPVVASTSVIDHIVTYMGHTIPVGAATLAAEPTGVTGVDSAPSSSATLQGSAPRASIFQSWVCASLAMVFGAVALVL